MKTFPIYLKHFNNIVLNFEQKIAITLVELMKDPQTACYVYYFICLWNLLSLSCADRKYSFIVTHIIICCSLINLLSVSHNELSVVCLLVILKCMVVIMNFKLQKNVSKRKCLGCVKDRLFSWRVSGSTLINDWSQQTHPWISLFIDLFNHAMEVIQPSHKKV